MKASINWLKEFIDFSLTPKEIANALTMSGLEVEGMVPNSRDEDDKILEVSVPPNRPDCLSIKGIAREISSVLRLPFKETFISLPNEEGECPIIEIKEPQLCRRYTSRIVRGVKIGPSPQWISKRLESHGIRSTNNVVDITNYVLLEMGHPLHAFDLDKLAGNRIRVGTSNTIKQEIRNKIKTIDGIEREVSDDSLLIWDAEKPVAIAGVMGGLDTEVTPITVNILLESAYFYPTSIRRTSKALNLSTESSYRFERGADIEGLVFALNRAAQLIIELAGGKVTAMTDNYPEPFKSTQISVRFSKINNVLGTDINPSEVEELLIRLGFETRREGEGITVIPPSFRQDIQRDIDVIEEIARLYGYDKIPATLPAIRIQSELPSKRNLLKIIKDSMRRSGYSEVINYSFLNSTVFDSLKLHQEDSRRNVIKIKNPLRSEESALRTTLIPALLNNVSLNINRGEKSLMFFELSRVFLPSGEKLPEEPLRLAAVYLKNSTSSLWYERHDGFYNLKGAVENLFLELRIRNYSFASTDLCEPYLHHGKSCTIKVGNQNIGSLGTLHPTVSQGFDITGDINLFELDIQRLLLNIPSKITYKPLPQYPYVERDISIVVSQDITVEDVKTAIWGINSELIESVSLFDIYTGPPIPLGKKSLAFSIRYRAEDRTLTDSEVNELHFQILNRLEDSLKAELRS